MARAVAMSCLRTSANREGLGQGASVSRHHALTPIPIDLLYIEKPILNISLIYTHTHTPSQHTDISSLLTNKNLRIPGKLIRRNLQIQRSRSLTNPPANIIVTSVTGTEPSIEIPRATNGHASQVSANTQHHKPLGLDGTIVVRLLVAKQGERHARLRGYLGGGSMTDEDGFASPLDRDGLAGGDGPHVEFGRGQGEDVGTGAHGGYEFNDEDAGGGGICESYS
eukprot:scaffold8102_cov73-Cyclotella_meneghiniana.AAC.18